MTILLFLLLLLLLLLEEEPNKRVEEVEGKEGRRVEEETRGVNGSTMMRSVPLISYRQNGQVEPLTSWCCGGGAGGEGVLVMEVVMV